LVAAVPGLELVEMPRARGETACCGGPATGYQPDLGRALAAERAREAAAVGAEAILTPCPGCIASLEEAARAEGLLADDVVGPLARALGIEHASPLPSLLSGGTVDDALERAAGNLWERTHPREEVERFVAALLARGRAR
jgi:Fe-S oxidoreductase